MTYLIKEHKKEEKIIKNVTKLDNPFQKYCKIFNLYFATAKAFAQLFLVGKKKKLMEEEQSSFNYQWLNNNE